MLSQMPRSFTTRFQFVPTCEQTFWGYSQLGTNFDKVVYRQTRVGDKLGTNLLYRYQQKCLLAFHSQLNLYSVYLYYYSLYFIPVNSTYYSDIINELPKPDMLSLLLITYQQCSLDSFGCKLKQICARYMIQSYDLNL